MGIRSKEDGSYNIFNHSANDDTKLFQGIDLFSLRIGLPGFLMLHEGDDGKMTRGVHEKTEKSMHVVRANGIVFGIFVGGDDQSNFDMTYPFSEMDGTGWVGVSQLCDNR